MRIKNQDFSRKVRLCLCLIWGLGLLGCSVFKPESKATHDLKNYRVVVETLPGYDESSLLTVLHGSVIISVERPFYTAGFKELPEQFILSIGVNDEPALQSILRRLQSSGFRISGAALQN